jgi:hypothetical protein
VGGVAGQCGFEGSIQEQACGIIMMKQQPLVTLMQVSRRFGFEVGFICPREHPRIHGRSDGSDS